MSVILKTRLTIYFKSK